MQGKSAGGGKGVVMLHSAMCHNSPNKTYCIAPSARILRPRSGRRIARALFTRSSPRWFFAYIPVLSP